MPNRSLSGVEVTDDVCNAYGGFGYAQPPVYEQTPKQVRGDVTFHGDGTLRGDRVGKCHAKDVRVKPEHDKAVLDVAERQNLCRAASYAVAASIAERIIYHRQTVYKVNGFLRACAFTFAALYAAALAVLDYGGLVLRTVRAVYKNALLRSRKP